MSKQDRKKTDASQEQKPVKKHSDKPRKAGRTPHEVMSQHIRDKDDVITEEDFKNLVIGTEVNDTAEEPLEISSDTERPKDEDKDPAIITPWDLVS